MGVGEQCWLWSSHLKRFFEERGREENLKRELSNVDKQKIAVRSVYEVAVSLPDNVSFVL